MLVKYDEQLVLSVGQIKFALSAMKNEVYKNPEFFEFGILLDSIIKLLCRYETISRETLLNLDILGDRVDIQLKNNLLYLHNELANQDININFNNSKF